MGIALQLARKFHHDYLDRNVVQSHVRVMATTKHCEGKIVKKKVSWFGADIVGGAMTFLRVCTKFYATL